MTDVLAVILASDVIGVLDCEMTVSVAEISRGGCLLESSSAIPVGTVATLSVEIAGALFGEDVRVTRCLNIPGGGERHYVAVEFLTLRRPGRESLRRYAAALGVEWDSGPCTSETDKDAAPETGRLPDASGDAADVSDGRTAPAVAMPFVRANHHKVV